MKAYLIFFAALFFFCVSSNAQVGIGNTSPDPSAILDLTSTSKGLLPPRMTNTQMTGIVTPVIGLLVYCNDCNPTGIWIYDPTWRPLVPAIPNATFGNATINCTGALAGSYNSGQPMTTANTKTFQIQVLSAGQLTATTNSVNGVTFVVTKLHLGTGTDQQIVLTGNGTPTTAGTFTYTVTLGGQNCNFVVNYLSSTSGGTAVVSSYNCTGADAGTLLTGIPASGVTHTITAIVTSAGTYNLSTNTVNGVTYSGSGTFSGTGNQSVVLTASGTPIAYGSNSYMLTSIPTCSFNVFANQGSSGGSAVVSTIDCAGADAGTMTVGIPMSGVTHTITATVTTAGTYNISAVKNGITFSASGTFSGTGAQNVVLTTTGTPVYAGLQSYTLNVIPNCTFIRIVTPAVTCNCSTISENYFPQGDVLSNALYSGACTITYTSGNGTAYGAESITVDGLIFTRPAGVYAVGGGSVQYQLTGTHTTSNPYAVFTFPEGCMNTVTVPYVETLAGNGTNGLVNGTTANAQFNAPSSAVCTQTGIVYVADTYNHCIRKIFGSTVTTFVGSGVAGYADGTGAAAQFNGPVGLWLDSAGNLYIADTDNHRIRKATPAGVVTTLAGSGAAGSANGNGIAAQFNHPTAIVLDAAGNMFITDFDNHKIRKMTPALDVTSFAGSGVPGFNNGTGAAAQFNNPFGITKDAADNLYVSDYNNFRIRKITPAAVVTTFAGSGVPGGANGTGGAAEFFWPSGLATDGGGNILVADFANHKIRRITPAQAVTTLAGTGIDGYLNAITYNAKFSAPRGICVDNYGRILVADGNNHRIRAVTP